ncbi:uncharacterized protein LOC135491984 isoform X2 [Lineus longissimus]|uniref:uncharacterized protein LOC135491984 isoform X2 n=1 Tax=Lineus longissimus TaxID=88925 RepID=UPI00315DD55B
MITGWNLQIFPFFGALLLWCACGQTQEIRDCLQANATCHQDSKCSSLLIHMPRLCGDSGSLKCATPQTMTCRTVLKTILAYNYFQTCVCPHSMPNYEECEFFRDNIFHHPCGEIHQEGKDTFVVKTNANERDDEDEDYDARMDYDAVHDKRSDENGPSCVDLRKECLADRTCNRDLTNFRKSCKVRRGRCYAESSGRDRSGHGGLQRSGIGDAGTAMERCIQSYEALRPYGLFRCSCVQHKGHQRRKCNGLMRRFMKNACLVVANEAAIYGKEAKVLPQKPGDIPEDGTVPDSDPFPPLEDDDYEGEQAGFDKEEEKFTPSPRLIPPSNIPATDVSCYDAFTECNRDSFCRGKMGKFVTSCQWDLRKSTCDRALCLPAMDEFFQSVDMNHGHAAAFCICERNDIKCASIHDVLQPKCAVAETPTPPCLSLYTKCRSDAGCRRRWEYYDNYCNFDKKTGACSNGDQLCRDAIVGLMGTLLMTNCTCEGVQGDTRARCNVIHEKLVRNQCREIATSTKVAISYETTPTTKLLKDDKDMVKLEVNLPVQTPSKRRCDARVYNERTLLRIYVNNTDCSELCKCLRNNTFYCRQMPCLPNLFCREGGVQYAHGSVFTLKGRGTCKCTRGEIICAKAIESPQDDGLFLHVGYSENDLKILRNYSVRVTFKDVSEKLTRLLNGETDNWECGLRVYAHKGGNIDFMVLTLGRPHRMRKREWSVYNPYDQQKEAKKDDAAYSAKAICMYPAKLLSYMINSRHPSVTKDPQLSMIKVATVDDIQHQAAQKAGSKAKASSSSTVHCSYILVIVTLLCTSWTTYLQRRNT